MTHPIEVTPTLEQMRHAARLLSRANIWTKQEFWVDEYDREVPADDPTACNRDYVRRIDYDLIVAKVVEYLNAPVPDWVEDPTLTSEEKLARFNALDPQPTRGPDEATP